MLRLIQDVLIPTHNTRHIRGESLLLDRYGAALAAEVLIVPHHGSVSSSTAAFADAVRPAFAVVSAGYRNRYGFPHGRVVARYRNRGARMLNTARQGAISIEVGRHAIRVTTYRESGWGFWRSGGGEQAVKTAW